MPEGLPPSFLPHILNIIDSFLIYMNIQYLFLISLVLSVVYTFFQKKRGVYQRYSFLVSVFFVAVFLTVFLWFWLFAFERMKIKGVSPSADAMFF